MKIHSQSVHWTLQGPGHAYNGIDVSFKFRMNILMEQCEHALVSADHCISASCTKIDYTDNVLDYSIGQLELFRPRFRRGQWSMLDCENAFYRIAVLLYIVIHRLKRNPNIRCPLFVEMWKTCLWKTPNWQNDYRNEIMQYLSWQMKRSIIKPL